MSIETCVSGSLVLVAFILMAFGKTWKLHLLASVLALSGSIIAFMTILGK